MLYQATVATRQSLRHRETALRASAGDIVATRGFRAATVKAIAAGANVSAGTLYNYFRTREELLVEVFRVFAAAEFTAARAAVDAAEPLGATAQLRALVETFSDRAVRGHRLAWSLLFEPVDPLIESERLEYRRSYSNEVAEIVTRGICDGELPDQDANTSGAGIVGAISEAFAGPLSLLDDDAKVADDLIRNILDLCVRAVGGATSQSESRRQK